MFNRENVYKIKASEFDKFRAEYTSIVAENAVLKQRLESGVLLEEIRSLNRTIKSLTEENSKLTLENSKLNHTIKTERATASLILQKLKEVTDIYERTSRRDSLYITAIDLTC